MKRKFKPYPFLGVYEPKIERTMKKANKLFQRKYEITDPEEFWSYLDQMEAIPIEVWEEDAGEIVRIVEEERLYDPELQKLLVPKIKS